MADLFQWLVPVSITAVFVVLCVGIFAMMRGGEFNSNWSNKLMQLRMVMQFIAIVIIMGAVYFAKG